MIYQANALHHKRGIAYVGVAVEVAQQAEFSEGPPCHEQAVDLVDPLHSHRMPKLIIHRRPTLIVNIKSQPLSITQRDRRRRGRAAA